MRCLLCVFSFARWLSTLPPSAPTQDVARQLRGTLQLQFRPKCATTPSALLPPATAHVRTASPTQLRSWNDPAFLPASTHTFRALRMQSRCTCSPTPVCSYGVTAVGTRTCTQPVHAAGRLHDAPIHASSPTLQPSTGPLRLHWLVQTSSRATRTQSSAAALS